MECVNIVYIDDIEDIILERHIHQWSTSPFTKDNLDEEINKKFSVINFTSDMSYEALLEKDEVKQANVILIDNHLFEERTAQSRFSGKQFKVILRKLLPYIEVIIITQDQFLHGANIVKKFSGTNPQDAESYYDSELIPKLDEAISSVLEFNNLATDLSTSQDIEKCLKESVINSIHGNVVYETLDKKDIDNLIIAFQEVKNAIEKQ